MDKVIKDVFRTGEVSHESILAGKVSALNTKTEDILDMVEDLEGELDDFTKLFNDNVDDETREREEVTKSFQNILEVIKLQDKQIQRIMCCLPWVVSVSILEFAALVYMVVK